MNPFALPLLLLMLAVPVVALAQNSLIPGTPESEFPSFQTLSIKLPITGDDNRNATVSVRFRSVGSADRGCDPWFCGLDI
jgi:hypothetical protein